jgi:hypothetical protein
VEKVRIIQRIFCLAIILITFTSFMYYKTAKNEFPSIKNKLLVEAIDSTGDLMVGYNCPKSAIQELSWLDIKRYNIRQEAFKSLKNSKSGIRALMNYWEKESRDNISPHLVEVANETTEAIYRNLKSDPDYLEIEELRSFLLSAERSPVSVSIPAIADVLSFEKLTALSDVWLSWLRNVNPNHMVEKLEPMRTINPSLDQRCFISSCNALRNSYDPKGITLVTRILRKFPADDPRVGIIAPRREAIEYLFTIGANDGFEEVLRYLEPMPCNDGQRRYLSLADETQAIKYVTGMQCPPLIRLYYSIDRPDLSRGLALALINDPEMRKTWENDPKTEPVLDRKRLEVFRQALPILPVETILKEAIIAEERGTPDAQAFWIELLGRKDSNVGTNELVKWTSLSRNNSGKINKVKSQAARALLRRLLMPGGERIMTELSKIGEGKKAQLVEEMLRDSGFISGLALRVGGCRTVVQVCISKNIPNAEVQSFLLAHEELLMDLIKLIHNPDRLCSIFALMKNEEAKRRFLNMIDDGKPEAISLIWFLDLDIPKEHLLKALELPQLTFESRMFLRLRLAELGDEEAYNVIRRQFLTGLNVKGDQTTKFRGSILDLMVQKRDLDALKQSIENVKEGIDNVNFFFTPHDVKPSWRKGWLLALLLRTDGNAFLRDFSDPNLQNKDELQKALQVAINSQSPNAEILLKKMVPLTKQWCESIPKAREKDVTLQMWHRALVTTGTPWCRDQLYEMKQWTLLGQLGDMRAAEADVPSAVRSSQAQDIIACVFQAGDVHKAISFVSQNIKKDARLPGFIVPAGGGYLDSKYFPIGHKKKVLSDLTRLYPTFSLQERLACFRLLGASPASWPDELVTLMLNDTFAPVRLSILLHLLKYPRDEFRQDVTKIAASDPYPWCRRVAHEILIFEPDPLNPGKGITFALP